MKAALIIRDRLVFDDGTFSEIIIWHLPAPVPPTTHGYKYRLFYGRPGQRLIGYDNERGKGDHRHYGDREEAYRFVNIARLLADFDADIDAMRGEGR